MALAIDFSGGNTNRINMSIASGSSVAVTTVQSNEIVVALVGLSDTSIGSNTLSTTISGGGLSWNLAKRSNTQKNETAEVWWALASSTLSGVTFTATLSGDTAGGSFYTLALHILTFTGANTGGPVGASGAATHASGTSSNPSITLTGTIAGSYCVAAGADYSGSETIAAGSAQTLLTDYHDTADGCEMWCQRTTSTIAGGNQTINTTGLGTDQWDFVAVEILAAGAAFTWQQLTENQMPAEYLSPWEVNAY